MSRLIDKLNRVARVTVQPMGFGAARPASSEPRIILIASLAQTADLADCIEGADAVLFRLARSGLAAGTLQKITAALPDIPWGGRVADTGAKKMATLVKAGCDFVVLTAKIAVASTPRDDKVGKILQVEPSLDDSLLRTVNDLPVDAVLVADTYESGDSMAWHHLMQFQRLANLITKPLLVSLPPHLDASELRALWEAGVDGVVVEVDAALPGGVRELRRLIKELPPRSSRKRGKAEPLLPYTGRETGTAAEEEEEDAEDE